MKRIFLIAMIVGAVHFYEKYMDPHSSQPFIAQAGFEENESNAFSSMESAFRCDGREYCSQMRSYEEAKFFNDNCPNTKMDGDNDGIPCERQFGR